MQLCEPADLIVTTPIDMEKVAATYIAEALESVEIKIAPMGFKGLIVICGARNKQEAAEKIKREVPEVERVYIVERETEAVLESISSTAVELSRGRIGEGETFAVRTVRRGSHSFTSIDVNVAVGARVREATGAEVDLEEPDKIIMINIIGGKAYLSIVQGSEVLKKMRKGKKPVYKLFWRMSVAHEPYLGPPDAARSMGVRVGRAAQSFEVGELVVAPIGLVDAEPLVSFVSGLFEGIESRLEIQRKSYGREVRRVAVRLQDMYQFVRSRVGEPLLIFEPEGEPVAKVAEELGGLLAKAWRAGRRINLMIGARSGVPTGLFRFADFVLDLAPGVVLSTELALPSALTAIATIVHEKLEESE